MMSKPEKRNLKLGNAFTSLCFSQFQVSNFTAKIGLTKENEQNGWTKKHFGIVVSESLLTEFKKHLSKENTTLTKIIGQFMMNYTDYLDSSFLDGVKSPRRKGIRKAQVAKLS